MGSKQRGPSIDVELGALRHFWCSGLHLDTYPSDLIDGSHFIFFIFFKRALPPSLVVKPEVLQHLGQVIEEHGHLRRSTPVTGTILIQEMLQGVLFTVILFDQRKKQYNCLLYSLHAYTMHCISWSPTLQYTWTIFIQEMYDSRKKQYTIASHWISWSYLPNTWTDSICTKAPNIVQLHIINFLSCVRTTLDPLDL